MDIDKTRGQIMSYINTKYKPVSCLSLRDSSDHSQDTEQCPIRQQDPTQIRTHNCQIKRAPVLIFPVFIPKLFRTVFMFFFGVS